MPLEFEIELCDLLQRHGWIDRISAHYQDISIEWTPLGLSRGKRFVEEVRALRPDYQWTDEELSALRAFGIYVGFIEANRRDRTITAVRPFINMGRDLLVITTGKNRRRRYRLFTGRAFGDFYEYIESEQDAGREVILVAIKDILESNVWKFFPFGKSFEENQ